MKYIVEAQKETGVWVPAVRGTYNATGKDDRAASSAATRGEARHMLDALVSLGDAREYLRVRPL